MIITCIAQIKVNNLSILKPKLFRMKKILLTLMFLPLLSFVIVAQTEVASTISDVTVFKKNAQITRNISLNTSKGIQEIILTGISTYISPSSLQVQFGNSNSILLSAKYEKNYLSVKKRNKKIEDLQQKLDNLLDELEFITDKKNSLKGMENILNKNQDLGGGNSGFTPQQVIELSNSYEVKYLEIRKSLREISKKEKPLEIQIANTKKQLNELSVKFNRPSGNIILKISSKLSKPLSIECKYIVTNTGWYPVYDIRSKGISEKIQLNYNANIYQNTGVDWNNVSITVSTGNPFQNNNKPILNTLYTNIYHNNTSYNRKQSRSNYKSAKMAPSQIMAINEESIVVSYDKQSEVSENQLSIDFNILSQQSINSDGKENLIALDTYDLDTEYIYHSVPKLSKSVFLLAKISNWSKHNLVSGNANIFFEGGFVGTSYINPQVTSDSLLISMGVDNSIVIERKPIKEFTSSKFVGSNKKITIGYELIVKNKKSVPIKIELLDQIPVSKNKVIQVELEEKGSATYSKNTGKLKWIMSIDSRGTKKEKFIYSVKYPKKESVIGVK